MPNIGANSLAFMLDLDSSGFKKAFKEASTAYKSFSGLLNKQNKQLNKAGQSFLDNMTKKAGAYATSVKDYEKAIQQIQKAAYAKPIEQPVNFVVSTASQANLANIVNSTVNKALGSRGTVAGSSSVGSAVGPVLAGRSRGRSPRLGAIPVSAYASYNDWSRNAQARTLNLPPGVNLPPSSGLAYQQMTEDLDRLRTARTLRGAGIMPQGVEDVVRRLRRDLDAFSAAIAKNAGAMRHMAQPLSELQSEFAELSKELVHLTGPGPRAGLFSRFTGRIAQIFGTGAQFLAAREAASGAVNAIERIPGLMSGQQAAKHLATMRAGGISGQYKLLGDVVWDTPGAGVEDASAAASMALQLGMPADHKTIAAIVNAQRAGVSMGQFGGLAQGAKLAGLSDSSIQMMVANASLGLRARGYGGRSGEAVEAIGAVLGHGNVATSLKGMSASDQEQFINSLTTLSSASIEAAGGSRATMDLAHKMLIGSYNPNAIEGLEAIGLKKRATGADIAAFLNDPRKRDLLMRLAQTNPQALGTLGISSADLAAALPANGLNMATTGEVRTLSDAQAGLAQAAKEATTWLDSFTSALEAGSLKLNGLLGGVPSQLLGMASGGISTISDIASTVMFTRMLMYGRGGRGPRGGGGPAPSNASGPGGPNILNMLSQGGAGVAAGAGGAGLMSRMWGGIKNAGSKMAGPLARILGRQAAGHAAAGAAASTGIGLPVAAALEIGLLGWGLYDIGKTLLGEDESATIDPATSAGKLSADVASAKAAVMGGVESRIDRTNELLEMILVKIQGSALSAPAISRTNMAIAPGAIGAGT